MSIDPKFVELTADVVGIFLHNTNRVRGVAGGGVVNIAVARGVVSNGMELLHTVLLLARSLLLSITDLLPTEFCSWNCRW